MCYEDTPREDSSALIAEDVLEELIGGAVRYSVLDEGEVIRVCPSRRQGEARDLEVGLLFSKGDEEVIACRAISERQATEIDSTLLHLADIGRSDTDTLCTGFLSVDEGKACPTPYIDLQGT